MNRKRSSFLFAFLLTISASFVFADAISGNETENASRPNVVLIMVDDMGFSDLGCYGGEIKTPNLDRLASRGLRFTQFYNCAKCETTRTTLLSGQYYPEVKGPKLANCVTIAEAMKLGGYDTIMTGKWHLTSDPISRGFDRYFGHLSGATNFFTGDDTFRNGKEPFEVPENGFYTTDAMTDRAISFLKERDSVESDASKPFFLYVAYNAPHYPLQAPKEEVEKYLKQYEMGWDELRRTRFKRQKEMGLIPVDTKAAARPDDVPAWDSLSDEQRERETLMMATYAGMIDRVDQNVGKLVAHLEETGEMKNTLLMFLSDNGACPFQRTKEPTLKENLMPWDPKSYWTYDKGWAHACNTPFREYKQNQHEGGITTPFIAHWPGKIADEGSVTIQPGHLVDIMSTCLDVGGTIYPSTFRGSAIGKARGKSLAPIFAGKKREPHKQIFFSFYGKNNALRSGDWKLVNINFGQFELYNIASDRTELNDLSKVESERFADMKAAFEKLGSEVGETAKKKPAKKKPAKNGKKKSRNENDERDSQKK